MIKGQAYVFGDDVDTDQIYPGRYLELVSESEIARHAMEGADPCFAARFVPGSLIIAGKNFGCGSSREHAPRALKALGVKGVVAESFGRIFFRNAINVGLPVLICPGISSRVHEGDSVQVDLQNGSVQLPTGEVLRGEPLSGEVLHLLRLGGLIPFVRKQLGK